MAPATPAAALPGGLARRLGEPPTSTTCCEKADVVSLLRVQSERGSGAFVPTLREYTAGFGLTARRAALLRPEALILHPGPIVRGVEIASDVAELPGVADHRAGQQRGGRPDGGALPPARPGPRWTGPLVAERSAAGGRPAGPGAPGRHGGRPDRGAPGRRAGRWGTGWPTVGSDRLAAPGRTVLDAGGCVVGPGLVDLHTHLRQPGARGGRDGRDRRPGRRPGRLHRGGGHAQHRADARLGRGGPRRLRPGRHGHRRGGGGRGHHRGPGRRAAGPDGRAGRPGGAAVHRRRRPGCSRPA